MKQLRAIICSLLLLFLTASVIPVPTLTAAAAAAKDKPVFMYIYKDYESQEIGEFPHGVGQDANREYEDPNASNKRMQADDACVVSKPENDGTENKAAVFYGKQGKANDSLYLSAQQRPIKENFVLSFKTQVNDTSVSRVMLMHYDFTDRRTTDYGAYGAPTYSFMTINDSIKVGSTTVFTDVKKDTWYDIDLYFKRAASTVDVYINDKLVSSGVKLTTIQHNVGGFFLMRPGATGSDWYFDDVKFYISDGLVPDAELKADWDEYRASEWAVFENIDAGREYRYGLWAYHTTYNEFIMCVNGIRFFKDGKFHTMPYPLKEENGKFIVPVRAFAESFGATVGYDNGTITIDHNGKTMKVVPGSDTFYVNDRPSKLYMPAAINNGVTVMHLDVLTHFFGVDYELYDGDILSFTGPLEIPYTDISPLPYLMGYATVESFTLERIRMNLLFDIPRPDEVLEMFNAMDHQGKHPYIRITDFDVVREGMEKEPNYKKAVNEIINSADKLVAETMTDPETGEQVPYTIQYTINADGVTLSAMEPFRNIGLNCSFAYKVTGDPKYKDHIWRQIESMKTFPDLNHHRHSLSMGRPAHALYTIYDWLYDDWTEEQRQVIEDIIYRLVLVPGYEAYRYNHHCTWNMWASGDANQTLITGGGIMGCALAMMDKYPELCSQLVTMTAESCRRAYLTFGPEGAWEEGCGYWSYAVEDVPMTAGTLMTALGNDFTLCDAPGFNQTAYFVGGMMGATNTFNFGDDYPTAWGSSFLMFHARRFNDMQIAAYYKQKARGITSIENWVWDEEIGDVAFSMSDLPMDQSWKNWETTVLRTGRAIGDTYAVLHGGDVNASHGHTDNGSFQLDMLGVRWAGEVPKEDYQLVQYSTYDPYRDKPATDDTVYYYPVYYRGKAEGHNTVIADLKHGSDQVADAFSPIIKKEFTDSGSYSILDMTTTNEKFECGLRGMKLDKITGDVVLQDDFTATEPIEFFWSMHTTAAIDIAPDGRSAILTEQVKKGDEVVKTDKRIWVGIISEGDHKLTKMNAEPLQGYYDIPTWQTSNGPDSYLKDCPIQWQKLLIRTPKVTEFKVSVAFAPLVAGETVPSVMPQYVPMEQWSFAEAELAVADSILVDGEPLEGFRTDVTTYDLKIMRDTDPIPKVEVKSASYDVETYEATSAPGVTTVLLKEDGVIRGKYTFAVTPLNDTSVFLNDKQIPIVGYEYTSEPEANNPARHVFDGNLNTKYACDETGGGITIDFGSMQEVHDVKMAFKEGLHRKEFFTIEYSTDGINFTECYNGSSSGTSNEHESFVVNVNARYIRVKFFGNSAGSNWVSVTELCAFTK